VSKAEYFRDKAVECDKLADEAKDVEAKRLLREAGENWPARIVCSRMIRYSF
jgi:hypothetical protein